MPSIRGAVEAAGGDEITAIAGIVMQKGRAWQVIAAMAALMNRMIDSDAASVRQIELLQEQAGADIGVILVQVDQLARINTSAGTETGDALLEEVARRLEGFAGDEFGQGSVVERIGGPRFVIVPATSLSLGADRKSVV